jgi:predicted RNase H-like nuclease
MRPMLAARSQAEASAIGRARREGGGLSAQAWNIVPKIREADALLTPDLQERVREGHPEVAFARLGGGPMAHRKKTAQGRTDRLGVLTGRGLDGAALLRAVREAHPKRAVADDDVIDAAVLALSAQDALAGRAWRLGDGARDARGLLMELWG